MKIKDELKGKEYLINLYETLIKNLQFDREFESMNHIVHKMYEYDKNMAKEWTIYLLNKYTVKGLADFGNEYNSEPAIMEFIKQLITDLQKNFSYKEIILIINNKIEKGFNRFYLWRFLLKDSPFYDYFKDFIEKKYCG